MAGDEDQSEYTFLLGRRGKQPEVTLHFFDFPGEWIEGNNENRSRVIQKLQQSSTILLAIDTPPLMVNDCHSSWQNNHNKKNRDKLILDIFKEIPKQDLSEKLILLTPIKCEYWVKNRQDADLLVSRVKEGYKELLAELENYSNIAVAITPVQTLGNLHYSYRHLISINNKEELKDEFRTHLPDKYGRAKYDPRNIEQPLVYTLSFLLRQFQVEYELQRTNVQKFLDDRFVLRKLIDDLIGIDDSWHQKKRDLMEIVLGLGESLEKLASKRLDGGREGFHVLRGKQHFAGRI